LTSPAGSFVVDGRDFSQPRSESFTRSWLEADQPDAAVHVYLEEVEADGRCRYVKQVVGR
jgi:hypothetical protein